jgi:uncharacterized lipoprotein YddW (UPF0748 family)
LINSVVHKGYGSIDRFHFNRPPAEFRIMKKFVLTAHLLLVISCCLFSQPPAEFRAVWIATVDNIDWPTKGNINSDSQRVEFTRMLDMQQRNGMNAVVVQIRPAADAFYPSSFEPWSEWLTGKQGRMPSPYYDPLQFMIEETHKRGMEFHAWCNPYRAVFKIGESSIAPSHVTRVHPDWFLDYGETRYFDPGNKEVQEYVTLVVQDIVKRYDIDAVHFDDYFYPYRIAGKVFPDEASYRKYGNGLSREDWRRSNVDSIIVMLGKAIKEEKKYCKFGISPFGIWRNKDKDPEGSDTHAGQTNYDDLYANIVLWLKNGWIDYVAPQLYFNFGYRAAPYEVLLDWWSKHSYGRQCFIGLGIFKAGSNPAWRDRTLLTRELQALRSFPEVQGAIYFSSKSFERNPNGWNDSLQQNYYNHPAVVPPMKWIDSISPLRPDSLTLCFAGTGELGYHKLDAWLPGNSKGIRSMLVYVSNNINDLINHQGTALKMIVPNPDINGVISYTDCDSLFNAGGSKKYFIGVTLLSRTNNESAMSNIFCATQQGGKTWTYRDEH